MAHIETGIEDGERYPITVKDEGDFTCECLNICAKDIDEETPDDAQHIKHECDFCDKAMCNECAAEEMGKVGEYKSCNDCRDSFAAVEQLARDYVKHSDANGRYVANQALLLISRLTLEKQESKYWQDKYTKTLISLKIKEGI